jgi:hypothetical protein
MARMAPALARVALFALLFVPAHAAPAQGESPKSASAPDDARVRKAFSFLTEAEQADVLEEFAAEVEWLDTFQTQLLRFALSLEERDPGLLPLDQPAPFFDPKEHAPGQPIARKRLDPDSSAARKERERIFRRATKPKVRGAWRYDWGQRELVRTAPESLERTFENALAGCAPGHDLAIAIVERALDDGSQQAALAAFGHAYTDRVGTVFPGITLYDAWSSGEEIEMPDVDVLGIVHTLLGIRDRWTAPVPDSEHKELYAAVGAAFQDANRHRSLRAALAATFLDGTVQLGGPYPTCLERFHSLWEANASTPAEVAKLLPKPAAWGEFLSGLAQRLDADRELAARAELRRSTLDKDHAQVRALLLRLLESRGAFERTSRPKPPPAPAPVPEKPSGG